MKILLLGKDGQVGWELQRSLSPLGELIALGRQGTDVWCGDLTDAAGLEKTIAAVRPQVIVNAAAYTAVDKAETEIALAEQINAEAPAVLARAARSVGAWLVHYSTDYVFDGKSERIWRETDMPAPLSVYGRTKYEGEVEIQASGAAHLIFRTSWVYAARGGNFVKTILRLAREREQLNVVNDQEGVPTGAELIADVTAHALRAAMHEPDKAGLYHLAAAGQTTWHAYAQWIVERALALGANLKVRPDQVLPVPTSAFPTPAQRPQSSLLDSARLCQTFGLKMPSWQAGVTRMLDEILQTGK